MRRFLCSFSYLLLAAFLFAPLSLSAAGASSKAAGPIPLDSALKELGARLSFDPLSRLAVLELGSHRLSFICASEAGEGTALFDGSTLIRASSPYTRQGELFFPRDFLDAVAGALKRAREDEQSHFRIAAILIDPGHGGKDPGATASHMIDGKRVDLAEKDIALAVAKEYHKRLCAAFPDKKILLTRTGDTYPSLEQRVAIANSVPLKENEAVIFISIHLNASFNKKARGYEVWYLSPEYRRTVVDKKQYADSTEVIPILNAMLEEEFTTESIVIARHLMSRLDTAIGKRSPTRGVKAEEWFVVRNSKMPAVLAELGFITSPEDARLLSDPLYLHELSEALYSGTVDFVRNFERSGGFTVVQ